MAKTKKSPKPTTMASQEEPTETPETLYAQALTHLEHSEPDLALSAAQKLIAALPTSTPQLQLPALNLLGEVNVELGNVEEARSYFLKAVALDPEGAIPETLGGGAEKFLWLAQLCEEGGSESVGWFEKGVRALKHEIEGLEGQDTRKMSEDEVEARDMMVEEKKGKLAEALCAVAEVYMTDLSYVLPPTPLSLFHLRKKETDSLTVLFQMGTRRRNPLRVSNHRGPPRNPRLPLRPPNPRLHPSLPAQTLRRPLRPHPFHSHLAPPRPLRPLDPRFPHSRLPRPSPNGSRDGRRSNGCVAATRPRRRRECRGCLSRWLVFESFGRQEEEDGGGQ